VYNTTCFKNVWTLLVRTVIITSVTVEQRRFDEARTTGSMQNPISLDSSQSIEDPVEIHFDETGCATYCKKIPHNQVQAVVFNNP